MIINIIHIRITITKRYVAKVVQETVTCMFNKTCKCFNKTCKLQSQSLWLTFHKDVSDRNKPNHDILGGNQL